MAFAGINYMAVIAAAIAGFAVGMGWYGIFGRRWMSALGKTANELRPDGKPPLATIAISFVCEVVMAGILAGILGHLGSVTVSAGAISALLLWLGLIATTQLVNHRYGRFPLSLTLIDTGHWLVVLVVMGAIIGAFGV